MNAYTITYSHGPNSDGGELAYTLPSDRAAVRQVREFVAGGYRNATTATVVLSDGRSYSAANEHGQARGRYSDALPA